MHQARFQALGDQSADHVPVLGVHQGHPPGGGQGPEGGQQLPVVQVESVGHVVLEGGTARLDHPGHLVEVRKIRGLDGHVETEVGHRSALRLPAALLQGFEHGLARPGLDEVQEGGGPAQHGRPGPAGEVIRRVQTAHVVLKMDVDIDASGGDQTSPGLHPPAARKPHPDGRDPTVAKADVGLEDPLGGDHRASRDHQVHRCLLPPRAGASRPCGNHNSIPAAFHEAGTAPVEVR